MKRCSNTPKLKTLRVDNYWNLTEVDFTEVCGTEWGECPEMRKGESALKSVRVVKADGDDGITANTMVKI